MEAVDRLLGEQDVHVVMLTTGGRSCRQGEGPTLPIGAWNAVRRLATRYGVTVPETRANLGREQAARFASALRRGAAETAGWSDEDREAVKSVVDVLAKNDGLVVSPVQGTPSRPASERQARPMGRPGTAVILDSARDQQSGLRVVTDGGFWAWVCGLAAENGHAVQQDEVIPRTDAGLLAVALRRGVGRIEGSPQQMGLLWRVIDLCERGDGVVVTRRVTN